MKRRFSLQRQRGQGMTEYIILVAVIALVVVVVAIKYGGRVTAMFNAADSEMKTTESSIGVEYEIE